MQCCCPIDEGPCSPIRHGSGICVSWDALPACTRLKLLEPIARPDVWSHALWRVPDDRQLHLMPVRGERGPPKFPDLSLGSTSMNAAPVPLMDAR